MPRKTFKYELESLHKEFEEMGEQIEEAINKSIIAFTNGDMKLAKEVCENDRYVNVSEKNIQSHALSLMLRQQPVAGDLRMVSAALRVATDMERIGDQAADIAELVLRICENGEAKISSRIEEMAATAVRMVKASVEAFSVSDLDGAKKVISGDDKVDSMFCDIKQDIVKALRTGADEDADLCIDLLMIAKHLEKIGDHAVNIAEWSIFAQNGILGDVRLI